MKQINLLFLLGLFSITLYSQNGQTYSYETKKVWVSDLIEIKGKEKRAKIISNLMQTVAVEKGYNIGQPSVVPNSGYGSGGTKSKIVIGGEDYNIVNFLDVKAKELNYIIDGASNISYADAKKACTAQLAVIIAATEEASKRGHYELREVKVYNDSNVVENKNHRKTHKIGYACCCCSYGKKKKKPRK